MDLWIKIRSLFDKQAVDAAAKGVGEVEKKTKDVGDAAKSAQGNTDKAFSAINASAQVAEGGVAGVGNAVRTLAGQFPALNAAIAPVGLALAAFAAWKKAIDAVKESREALERNLRDTQIGNIEAGVRSLAEAYGRLHKELVQVEEDRKRMADAEAAKDDARTAAELARIDLEAAEAAAKLNPEDRFARRRLDVETARKRAAVQDDAALRKSDRELSGIRGEAASLEAVKAAARETLAEAMSVFSAASGKQYEVMDKARQDAEGIGWYNGAKMKREKIWSEADKSSQQLAAVMQEASVQIQEATELIASTERQQYSLSQQVDVNMSNRETVSSRSQTGRLQSQADEAAIRREALAELERVAREKRDALDKEKDIRERAADLQKRADKENADVRRARTGYASDRSLLGPVRKGDKVTTYGDVEKEEEEARRAVAAVNDFAAQAAKALAELTAQMQKNAAAASRANEALRNLPGQN